MAVVPHKTLQDLAWSQLCAELAGRTQTSRARSLAVELLPLDEPGLARERVTLIAEVRLLAEADLPLQFGGIRDVDRALGHAHKGGSLEAEQLIAVATTARACAGVRTRIDNAPLAVPGLVEIAMNIDDLRHVYESILDSFGDDGRLTDHASPALGKLRRAASRLHTELEQKARSLLDDAKLTRYLQDQYYTQRDERYVVPVRVEDRGYVRGIVHGTSQSGQTVFIEPEVMVDLNNRLRLAECAVLDEEERILTMLSRVVAADVSAQRRAIDAATRLDVLAACARLADDLDAVAPTIEEHGPLRLERMRHPLMALSERGCVPNDIAIEPCGTIVVSGPNAGGKTVALKTVGLIALMTRTGLHVPAAAAQVPWFECIRSDIGDAQSIEKDLSTFSAHLLELRSFLEAATPGSLLLIDEVAVGTDPEQGAALAEAVLLAFAERGATTMVTTHYERLKAIAATDDRFSNASVGFDFDRMEPTFLVHLGVPGSSGAMHIARRMGLPEAVVETAEELAGDRRARLEDLLAELATARRELADQERAVREEHASAQRSRQDAAAALERARDRERKAHESAHNEAIASLREARAALEQAKDTVKRRRKPEPVTEVRRTIDKLAREITEHAPPQKPPPGRLAGPGDLVIGARVYVVSVSGRGTVLSDPVRGRVNVQVGAMKLTARTDGLYIEPGGTSVARETTERGRSTGGRRRTKSRGKGREAEASAAATGREKLAGARTADTTCDVRGERVDEALAEVDRFIDASLLRSREVIFVIHGHGTGALRSAVRAQAESHTAVTRWHAGDQYSGGDGVTVMWLED